MPAHALEVAAPPVRVELLPPATGFSMPSTTMSQFGAIP